MEIETTNEINDPNFIHLATKGTATSDTEAIKNLHTSDDACGEQIWNTQLTIGGLNKAFAAIVDNDIIKGEVVGTDLILQRDGLNSDETHKTLTIDLKSINTYTNNKTTVTGTNNTDGSVILNVTTQVDTYADGKLTEGSPEIEEIVVAGTKYVDTKVAEEAAIRNEADISLQEQINNNKTNITNNYAKIQSIEKGYVKNVSIEGDNFTFVQNIMNENGDVVEETVNYTDKHITGFTQALSEDGKSIVSTIETNFGTDMVGTINVGSVKVTVTDQIQNTTADYTIQEAITNNYNEAKKHTTIEKGLNIALKETTNEAGGKHYTISTATEVNFDKVTSDVVRAPELHSDVGYVKKVISEAVRSDIALIGNKVYVDSSGINMNNSDIKNANNIDTNTIILGATSTTNIAFDGERITYGAEKIANLNDGLYYTGDVSTDGKQDTYAKLNKNVKIYGGATEFTEDNNIGVETKQNGDNVEMQVRLAKDLKGLNTVYVPGENGQNGENGTTITEEGVEVKGPKGDQGEPGKTVTVKHDKVDVGGNTINNVARQIVKQVQHSY